MNYKIVFRDTFRLFRLFGGSKLLLIFGAFAVASELLYKVSRYSIGKHPVYCVPYLLLLIAIYFSFLAKSGLIYSAHQIVSGQDPTFSEAWDFSKTKVKRIIGFYFVSIPLVIFSLLIPELVRLSEVNASLTWVIDMLVTFFLNSLFILGICTIVTNDLESGLALWTSLQIMFNNFLHVVVLSSIFLILQILVTSATGNTFFGIVVIVPFIVTMALAYREFITKASYPALSNSQPTA